MILVTNTTTSIFKLVLNLQYKFVSYRCIEKIKQCALKKVGLEFY